MSKQIPVPPELQHLIEKREQETDRRQPKPSAGSSTPLPTTDSPPRSERRQKRDRRRRPKSNS